MSRDTNAFSGTYMPSNPHGSDHDHPSRQKLKGSTKTFAIVLLVLGIVGLISAIVTPIMALVLPEILKTLPDQDAQMKQTAEQFQNLLSPLSLALIALSFALSLAMIFGGIGTLRRSLAGANCLRVVAGVMVPMTLIQSGFGLYNLFANKGQILENFEEQMNQNGGNEMPQGMDSLAEVAFYFQVGIAAVIGLVFAGLYVWAFLHMSKATTMAQFEVPYDAAGRV